MQVFFYTFNTSDIQTKYKIKNPKYKFLEKSNFEIEKCTQTI